MTTAEKLLELKKLANEIEFLDEDDQAIVQLITVEGKFYPVFQGSYSAVFAVIEAAYKLIDDFKEISNDVVNGKSVLQGLGTNNLNK